MSFPSFTRKNQANWCKLLQLLSLQTSPQNFFFSLPIPSLCPASFFLLPKAKLASYVHLYALWSNLRLCLILIFHSLNLVLLPFDPKIFKSDLTSKPFSEALLPIYCLPIPHLHFSHPKIWKEWFVLLEASSSPLIHFSALLSVPPPVSPMASWLSKSMASSHSASCMTSQRFVTLLRFPILLLMAISKKSLLNFPSSSSSVLLAELLLHLIFSHPDYAHFFSCDCEVDVTELCGLTLSLLFWSSDPSNWSLPKNAQALSFPFLLPLLLFKINCSIYIYYFNYF